jgi:regulator of cell morphogenesis and NO signaling
MIAEQQRILKVYELEPRLKHPTIFEWFAVLQPGESFTLENDHDPKPLYYQMLAELGPVFSWQYVDRGPEIWSVVLQRKNDEEETVGSIAAKDIRKAETLKKLGIDFCCGGKKTIRQAAAEVGLTEETVQAALRETATDSCSVNSFGNWEADFLADYIYNQHHKYFYDRKDDLSQLAIKVTQVHGAHYPYLHELLNLINKLFTELKLHFHKEEKVLFPYIKELVLCKKESRRPSHHLAMGNGPLAMMEMEHETAGDILRSMRAVTNDYKLPENACSSFSLLYRRLEELEKDLQQHIHLENNILFPKALSLEKELS